MNRPIFIILIGYIIGIIWGLYFKISIVLFYIFLLVIYIIIQIQYPKKEFQILSIKRYFRYIKLVFKINIILTIIVSSFISNSIIKFENDRYENLFKNAQNLELTAIVISNKEEREYYNRYQIKVSEGKYKDSKLYINVNKDLEYGDRIQIKGEFVEPQTARNYKGFDYKEYLKSLKIYGTIKVKDVKILANNQANKLMQISNEVFLKIKNNIEKTYSEEISKIILGVMLGHTDGIDEETKEDFSKSNISHVLAVSGMHISYIIILVTNSTKKVLGKKMSKIIASIILMAYMCITGFSVSIVRASIMGILNCMAFVLYRKSDTLNNISIAALITLIQNPFNLTGMSFLLTYGGTIGIIYFNPTVEKIIKNVKIRNRRWKYVFLKIQRKSEKIIEMISVSISAQIIIAPIMILNYNTFGIGFLLTNLLLSLVIGIIVMGGFVQILISMISIKIGSLLAKLIEIPTYGLILISKIDIGNLTIITPDLYQIIFYYIAICILLYLYKIFYLKNCNLTQQRIKNTIHLIKYKLKPHILKIELVALALVFILIVITHIPHELEIYFIDVGQGDSTLIVTPNDKTILIDGGGSTTYDVGENILLPYLLDRKIKQIDYVMVSHFDQDHVGGILSILEKIKIENIIISKQGENSDNYQEFLKKVKEKKIQVTLVKKSDVLKIDKNITIEILWPKEEQITQNILNNNSIVAKLTYNNFTMLLTGDIEQIAEEEILKENSNTSKLQSTVLKVAHHGSKSSTIQEFLNEVNPRIALIGVGENNKFGHPNDEVLNRLEYIGSKIYRTDKMGEIMIEVSKNGKIIIKSRCSAFV